MKSLTDIHCFDPVPKPVDSATCQQGQSLALPRTDGYISSHVFQGTSTDLESCPWRLEAAQGQVINITLINLLSRGEAGNDVNYG